MVLNGFWILVDNFHFATSFLAIVAQGKNCVQAIAIDIANAGQVQHNSACQRYILTARDGNGTVTDLRLKPLCRIFCDPSAAMNNGF
jgi:hypothetical protein